MYFFLKISVAMAIRKSGVRLGRNRAPGRAASIAAVVGGLCGGLFLKILMKKVLIAPMIMTAPPRRWICLSRAVRRRTPWHLEGRRVQNVTTVAIRSIGHPSTQRSRTRSQVRSALRFGKYCPQQHHPHTQVAPSSDWKITAVPHSSHLLRPPFFESTVSPCVIWLEAEHQGTRTAMLADRAGTQIGNAETEHDREAGVSSVRKITSTHSLVASGLMLAGGASATFVSRTGWPPLCVTSTSTMSPGEAVRESRSSPD